MSLLKLALHIPLQRICNFGWNKLDKYGGLYNIKINSSTSMSMKWCKSSLSVEWSAKRYTVKLLPSRGSVHTPPSRVKRWNTCKNNAVVFWGKLTIAHPITTKNTHTHAHAHMAEQSASAILWRLHQEIQLSPWKGEVIFTMIWKLIPLITFKQRRSYIPQYSI